MSTFLLFLIIILAAIFSILVVYAVIKGMKDTTDYHSENATSDQKGERAMAGH
jgi:uncharacterized membrane protein YozB (DUF420 family)